MKIHRFYIEGVVFEDIVEIKDISLIHQWRDVFRMKVGDKVVLFNEDRFDYICHFEKLAKDSAELVVEEKRKNEIESKIKLTLCQAIIKKDNFEWIVEKGTELGVPSFQPIISERSEKKNLNIERLKVIAKEAVEQSGRGFLPEINEPKGLKDYLENFTGGAIAFDSSGSFFQNNNYKLLTNNFLFIGPEGGWTERELELFKLKNIPIVSFGKMTLRAETASISAISIFSILN